MVIKRFFLSLIMCLLFIACNEEEEPGAARNLEIGYLIEVIDTDNQIGDSRASYSFIGPKFQRFFSDDLERMPVMLDRFMEIDSGQSISLKINSETSFEASLYENDILIWEGYSPVVNVDSVYLYDINLGYDSLRSYPALLNYRLEIHEKNPEWDDFEVLYAKDSVILGIDSVEISNIRNHIPNSYEGNFTIKGKKNTVAIVQASGRQGMRISLFVEGEEISASFPVNANSYSNGVITWVVQ